MIVRKNIKEFTENGVIFEGTDDEVKVDHVLLATGYQLALPFIDSSIISYDKNNVFLYKNMFSPYLKHSHTFALIGLIQPLGAGFPAGELQSRWFAGLMAGYLKLPSKEQMIKVTDSDRKYNSEQFVDSPRHRLELHYIPFLEEMAGFCQVKPNLWKYFVTDPVLWYHLVFGLFVSYQFRLEGRNKWAGARDAIINVNKRIAAPFASGANNNNN